MQTVTVVVLMGGLRVGVCPVLRLVLPASPALADAGSGRKRRPADVLDRRSRTF